MILAVLLCLSLSVPAMADSALSWYNRKTQGKGTAQPQSEASGQPQEVPEVPETQTGGTGTLAAPSMAFQEVKLVSQTFGGAVVGKAVVPEGWSVQVQELGLGSESILWPNALYVTATSPAGDCVLNFLSKRTFQQSYANLMGYTSASEDDSYDYSRMIHMLDYRDADGVCDLMAGILYGTPDFESELPVAQERSDEVAAAKSRFDTEARELYAMAGQMSGGSGLSVQWTDVTIAARTYRIGSGRAALTAVSSGLDLYADMGGGSYTEDIYWNIECVYGMYAADSVFDEYQTVFDMFVSNTTVSQEYTNMTDLHAAHLIQYYLQLQNGGGVSEPEENAALEQIGNDTVGTGDTYSAMDGWSDVIREENDYITSDGTHIKVPSGYDHVFEGDDGRIYAGNSVDGPAGSTELTPTQIGQ